MFDKELIKKETNKSQTWFKQTLFNMLIDYYPEIVCRPYATGLEVERFTELLKDLKLGFVIVYAKGHSGRTTFKSSLQSEHIMLKEDLLQLYSTACNKAGVKLFFYYSGLLDGIAAHRHPEWRMLDWDGNSIKVLDEYFFASPICPQSDYFEKWVKIHFKEMMSQTNPDGFWIDGDWPGPCYCHRCIERFRKETGYTGPMPKPDDHNSETGIAWQRVWNNITREWRDKLSGLIKELNPSCLYSSGNVAPRWEYSYQCDWKSGDWFSPSNHRLQQSIMMRRYATQGLPYDAMTCDTSFVHPKRWLRSRTKTVQRMLQEGAGIIANGGMWCYWTYPMPNGAMVPSKMRTAKIASDFAYARRDVVVGTECMKWTAILDCEPRHNNHLGYGVWGSGKAMIALHRSPEIIDEYALTDDMPYDLIIIPEQPTLPNDVVDKLETFVKKGGKLLCTGCSIHSEKLQKLLGVKLVEESITNDGHVFLKNGDPAGVFSKWDGLEIVNAEERYKLYRSWDDLNVEMRTIPDNYPITGMVDEENPLYSGYAALTVRKFENGIAAHIPVDIFSQYWKVGDPQILHFLKEVLEIIQPDPMFKTDAWSFVEIVLRKKDNDFLVHFVNGNPGRDISHIITHDFWVDDIPSVGPITFTVKCAAEPNGVKLVPSDRLMEYEWDGNELKVVLPKLEIHSCVIIKDYFRCKKAPVRIRISK